MSVTGPASERKAPTPPIAPSKATTAQTETSQPGGMNGTSAEETNGVNSATSNSH